MEKKYKCWQREKKVGRKAGIDMGWDLEFRYGPVALQNGGDEDEDGRGQLLRLSGPSRVASV